jgi:hypothetical protein
MVTKFFVGGLQFLVEVSSSSLMDCKLFVVDCISRWSIQLFVGHLPALCRLVQRWRSWSLVLQLLDRGLAGGVDQDRRSSDRHRP